MRFPEHARTLASRYFSITSDRFHEVLARELGSCVRLGERVKALGPGRIETERGEIYLARHIVDGRGWVPTEAPVAYQKFLGQRVAMKRPHGLRRAVVMDATVAQEDGYRFFYCLPWNEKEILVEDTRYSDTPDLDLNAYRRSIVEYCARKGWEPDSISYEEMGALPIPLGGKAPHWPPGTLLSGTRAGLFHATTGYSLPAAMIFAERLTQNADHSSAEMEAILKRWARQHWRGEAFFRFLNRMMFWGARPSHRVKILQRFYRLPEGLIARFYAGKMRKLDFVRLLVGKPPIPVSRALSCVFAIKRNFSYAE